ncbi:MAG: hypothetical protein KQI78_25775, partial [Deltaproteobacteria bacterium]|nr:hypothetical protein [Deltaproteobacteria bacterium]
RDVRVCDSGNVAVKDVVVGNIRELMCCESTNRYRQEGSDYQDGEDPPHPSRAIVHCDSFLPHMADSSLYPTPAELKPETPVRSHPVQHSHSLESTIL